MAHTYQFSQNHISEFLHLEKIILSHCVNSAHFTLKVRCITKHYYVKVKVTLVQALRLCTGRSAHRGGGGRGITVLFLDHGTRRGEGSASRPCRSLPLGKTRYPLYRRLGGPQSRSGSLRKISPPPGLDPGPSTP